MIKEKFELGCNANEYFFESFRQQMEQMAPQNINNPPPNGTIVETLLSANLSCGLLQTCLHPSDDFN